MGEGLGADLRPAARRASQPEEPAVQGGMTVLSAEGATPTMAQWFRLKADNPDALLFFRMGDFYELFFADAEAAAAALDIALTQRGEHAGQPIPMCGVPVHAAEAYLARLIRRGFRVAVAEQMEAAKARAGKAPLRREIVRLVTPGTLTEDSLLDAHRPNLLLGLAQLGDRLGAAWLDVSTGLFETDAPAAADLPALLGRLEPAEILAPPGLALGDWAGRRGPETAPPAPLAARRRVAEAFGAASLDAFGSFTDAEAVAAALALDYVRATQAGHAAAPVAPGAGRARRADDAGRGDARQPGDHPRPRRRDRAHAARRGGPHADRRRAPGCWPPGSAARCSTRRRSRRGRMAGAGCCSTPAPLAALRDGAARRAGPGARAGPPRRRPGDAARPRRRAGDADRRGGDRRARCATRRSTSRRYGSIQRSARRCPGALADPLPARLDDGGVILAGFDGELDAERALRDDSRRVIAGLPLDYAQRFGVASLKIRHHAQLGYVIEAPAAAVETLRAHPGADAAPGHGQRRPLHHDRAGRARPADQRGGGAGGGARGAGVRQPGRAPCWRRRMRWPRCAAALARLDVLQSCARLAEGGRWCRPVVSDGDAFCIRGGRHPVVRGGAGQPRPRSCRTIATCRRTAAVLLLTGPNMAGKITFLRQNALVVILAQAGLPVPAESAEIGVVDRLFSRVGAADDLARGRSTFMVEMTETAAILHQAGPRSLVVVDEIGRGTARWTGWRSPGRCWRRCTARSAAAPSSPPISTSWPSWRGQMPRLCPHTMRVKEWRGSVVFLHEVAEGAAGRSWGVHVAELAGVPAPTVRRAGALLAALEKSGHAMPADLPLFAALEQAPAAAGRTRCARRWRRSIPTVDAARGAGGAVCVESARRATDQVPRLT